MLVPNSFPSWLRAHAETQPDRAALVAPSRSTLSWRSLCDQVAAFTGLLEGSGVARGARVALVLPASAEAVVALLGAVCHGSCAPLNPVLTAHEFEFELEDLQIAAIVVEAGQQTAAIEVATRRGIKVLTLPPPSGAAGTIASPSDHAVRGMPEVAPDQIALVLHTSGTTARAKIVRLTMEMLAISAASVVDALALAPADRYLSVMPLYHIHGLATLFGAIAAGCTMIVPRGFEPSQFWGIVKECDPTWYSAAPTIHQAILRTTAELARVPPARLRLVRSASAALSVSTIDELERTFKVPVIEFYGMTEASDQICTNPLPPGNRKPGSVGRPVAGMEVAIEDASGNLSEGLHSGEILIRGRAIIAEYENNPAANAAGFRDGWFRTGDLGHRDADGYLYLTGRAKEIINRGGEKISPREVDEVLMRHPAVHQAVTFAVSHSTLGEDVAAAIVVRPEATVTEREIRTFARQQLAAFKVPQQVLILDVLPKGATGKVQRIGLAEKLSGRLRADFVAPRDPLEEAFAMIWEEVLKVERVGVFDNYFAIGGDSFNAAIIATRAQRLGVSPELVFLHPTIVEIAAAHRAAIGAENVAEADAAAEQLIAEAREHAAARRATGEPSSEGQPPRVGFLQRIRSLWSRSPSR